MIDGINERMNMDILEYLKNRNTEVLSYKLFAVS